MEPTEFEIDVNFSPPGVIRVAWYFKAICVEMVPLDIVSDDEVKVKLQSSVEANPDCDEDWDFQDKSLVPFGIVESASEICWLSQNAISNCM